MNSKYSTISYDECKARLYNLVENVDYVEYDTVINLPLKKDYYTSAFKIENIIERWTSDNKINYKVQIDTLHYFNTEDSSIRYELKPGDIICLGNEMVTFTVKSILDNKIIHIEENVGYASLQPYSENTQMVFQIYVSDYSKFNYVQVPLEEDQYIIVFISTIWNNVRSVLSDGVLIDLNDIKMIDEFGSNILDKNGNQYTYLNYYKKQILKIDLL